MGFVYFAVSGIIQMFLIDYCHEKIFRYLGKNPDTKWKYFYSHLVVAAGVAAIANTVDFYFATLKVTFFFAFVYGWIYRGDVSNHSVPIK